VFQFHEVSGVMREFTRRGGGCFLERGTKLKGKRTLKNVEEERRFPVDKKMF